MLIECHALFIYPLNKDTDTHTQKQQHKITGISQTGS